MHRRRERKEGDLDVQIASDGESRIVRVGGESLRLREVKEKLREKEKRETALYL